MTRETQLIEIGIALSAERDIKKLLKKILQNAKDLTHADGGTLYTVTPDKKLHFEIIISGSLKINIEEPLFSDIPLFKTSGEANEENIGTYCANHKKVINIHDAYHESGFDFSGPRHFDEQHGYRTKSVLAVPMINHEGEVIGVLQLINAYDSKTNMIRVFSEEEQYLASSLASLAGVALTNQRLILDLKNLFQSFIRVIAKAIDEKSPSTGNHSRRVPILCELIAKALNRTGKTHFSEEDIDEMKVAAFLHDCGKITTPLHIQEKHTKLETIVDRIDLIATRFEVLKRDVIIAHLQKKLGKSLDEDPELEKQLAQLAYEEKLLEECNRSFLLTPEKIEAIKTISTHLWKYKGELTPLLNADELENLTLAYGTLTPKERHIIENHVTLTLQMLSELTFPKNLKKVPEIAASHHERVDGKGYPRGLKGEEMLLEAKILAVADVVEALSAPDRPYKKPLPLSTIHEILRQKVMEGHLDREIVAVFLEQKVGLEYAKTHLAPEQIDL